MHIGGREVTVVEQKAESL